MTYPVMSTAWEAEAEGSQPRQPYQDCLKMKKGWECSAALQKVKKERSNEAEIQECSRQVHAHLFPMLCGGLRELGKGKKTRTNLGAWGYVWLGEACLLLQVWIWW